MYSIQKLGGAALAPPYPQSAYSALQRSVQQEWQVLQRTTTNIESCVDLIEKAMKVMKVEYLPARFGEATDDADCRLARAHTFQ